MKKRMNAQQVETKIHKMADNLSRHFPGTLPLHLNGEDLLPMQVVQKLRGMEEIFGVIHDAEADRLRAEEALAKSLPEYRTFLAHAEKAIVAHLGSNSRALADLGVELDEVAAAPRAAADETMRRIVKKKVIEEVIGDRETRINEVDTEEEVETTSPVGRLERGRREMSAPHPQTASASTGPAGAPVVAAPARTTTSVSKKKGGSRS